MSIAKHRANPVILPDETNQTELHPGTAHLIEQLSRYPGLRLVLASLLEAAGPLTLLTAPLLRIAQPVLGLWLPPDSLEVAAQACEDPRQAQSLARRLRKESDG